MVTNARTLLLSRGGFFKTRAQMEKIHEYIVPPKLFPVSGLIGAYLLGLRAYQERDEGRIKNQ